MVKELSPTVNMKNFKKIYDDQIKLYYVSNIEKLLLDSPFCREFCYEVCKNMIVDQDMVIKEG